MMRTITPAEFQDTADMLFDLTALLLEAGIVELRISKREEIIFWDTEGKGQIDPEALQSLVALISGYTEQRAMNQAMQRSKEWR
jgi:hypothetical protein